MPRSAGMREILGRDELLVVRHRNTVGSDDHVLRRGAARGKLVRLRSGAYVRAGVWAALKEPDRMRLEAAAAHEVGRSAFVASHDTAAALWGMPRIRGGDGLVHARVSAAAGTRTEHGVRKHAVLDPELHLTEVHGITCTTLERTLLDLAMTRPFADAVVATDWALRLHTSRDQLQHALDELDPKRGRRRAQAVLDFSDPRSDSVGESLSRVRIFEQKLPAPLLQTRFDDALGLIGFVDFFWPDFALIGEFDGLVKYSDPGMLQGRTPAEALADEKLREDHLRATGPTVSRWTWKILWTPGALAAQLRAAGLR